MPFLLFSITHKATLLSKSHFLAQIAIGWFRLSACSTRVGCATIVSVAISSISAWLQVSYFFFLLASSTKNIIAICFHGASERINVQSKCLACGLMCFDAPLLADCRSCFFCRLIKCKRPWCSAPIFPSHPLHRNRRWLIASQARLSQIRLSRLKVNEASCTTACCVHCMV